MRVCEYLCTEIQVMGGVLWVFVVTGLVKVLRSRHPRDAA
jgi:hypothetical protein